MYSNDKTSRIKQGDILCDVEYFIFSPKEKTYLKITYPYTIVITQDCDLEQDYTARSNEEISHQDKFLESTLLLPAFLSEDVKMGTHLSMLGLSRLNWSTFGSKSNKWPDIQNNENKRFHCLRSDPSLQIPELITDFKFFFTLPHSQLLEIYEKSYQASINPLYRENISDRFGHYLSRIGLPT